MNVGFPMPSLLASVLWLATAAQPASTNKVTLAYQAVTQYLDSMHMGWFDAVLVLALAFGVFHGRKRGMSNEALPLLQWLAIMSVSGLLCQPMGSMLVMSIHVSRLFAYVTSYITCAIVLKIFFSLFQMSVGGKLVEADVFGFWEYYLGMLAGMLRWACVLICALALLHARLYTKAALDNNRAQQMDDYGMTFVPTLGAIQHQVFKESWSGKMIGEYLNLLLIPTTAAGGGLTDLRGKGGKDLDDLYRK